MKHQRNNNANRNANRNANNRNTNYRIKHEPETNYERKKNITDRIEPVSRAKALIPDEVILTRSGSLGTCHRIWRTPLPEMEDKLGQMPQRLS